MNKYYVILLVVLSVLLVSFDTISEPIPPDDDVPWGDWQVDVVYPHLNPARAELCYPSNADCQYRILTECIEPENPKVPVVGQWYRREGSRKWFAIDYNAQDLIWLQTLEKPREFFVYVPWASSMYRGCSCYCYHASVYVDGQFKTRFELYQYPAMNIVDFYLNLFPGQAVDVRYDWCGQPVRADGYYQWSTIQANCDGRPSTTLDCPGGVCPTFGCEILNGDADCRFTYSVQTCYLCVARHNGTDPLESYR